jgi:RNA ligase
MLKIQGLTPLEHFRLRVAGNPAIIEQEIAPGYVCFSVMKGVGTADTYDTPWAREARGITFSKYPGDVVSRPFHKFFNVNERASTQLNLLDWNRVVRVMDKRDGSMIHPVPFTHPNAGVNKIAFKSKKTFESDVALIANQFLKESDYFNFCHHMYVAHEATPIFELTGPKNRIVLDYEKPELKLLHVRDNHSGRYWSLAEIKDRLKYFNIPIVDEVTEFSSFEQMLEAAKTREDIEGWVIQFDDGEMVKIKTEWYMRRHRVMTSLRERDVVDYILDEKLDDIKAMLASDCIDTTPIIKIEKRFAEDMSKIINEVLGHYYEDKYLSPREIAAKHVGTPLFGLIMAKYNGKQPKYEDYFRKYVLRENYDLTPLGIMLGGTQGEEDASED